MLHTLYCTLNKNRMKLPSVVTLHNMWFERPLWLTHHSLQWQNLLHYVVLSSVHLLDKINSKQEMKARGQKIRCLGKQRRKLLQLHAAFCCLSVSLSTDQIINVTKITYQRSHFSDTSYVYLDWPFNSWLSQEFEDQKMSYSKETNA